MGTSVLVPAVRVATAGNECQVEERVGEKEALWERKKRRETGNGR